MKPLTNKHSAPPLPESSEANFVTASSPQTSKPVCDQEKLAKFMVENGMLTEELAKQALSLGKKHSIGFDEAIVYIEKSSARKKKNSNSKSSLSGSESSILKRLVENQLLTTEQAAQVVKDSLYQKSQVLEVLCQFEHLVSPKELEAYAVTLLINANLIVDDKKPAQLDFKGKKKFRPLVLLIAKGKISSLLEQASLLCAHYVNEEEMTLQEAKLILRYVCEKNLPFAKALKQLGLSYSNESVQNETEEPYFGNQIKEKLASWSSIVCSKLSYQN